MQVVGRESQVLNSVSVAFFDHRVNIAGEAQEAADSLKNDDVFSILFSSRDLLDLGKWQVVGSASPLIPRTKLPYENLRPNGFIGAKVIGSGNVAKFLNAFYALHPWDDWFSPHYLDGLLVVADKKPKTLIYKNAV